MKKYQIMKYHNIKFFQLILRKLFIKNKKFWKNLKKLRNKYNNSKFVVTKVVRLIILL